MSFVAEFNALPLPSLLDRARHAGRAAVDSALNHPRPGLPEFAAWLSPAAGERLETLCRQAQSLTRQRFGRTIRLFAPLYLSNECI
ncbi:MAG: 2-iminoacetate synthase ThiH, partial [Verrucomicrobiota bacterium]